MFSVEQHLDDLLGHIERVQVNCRVVGQRLIDEGQIDFGWMLIARGHVHDKSKFFGIEREFLHRGDVDIDKQMLAAAIRQHVATNSHHPEFHGGFHSMPELDTAEMVCDCAARAQEFCTDLRKWYNENAIPKYKIDVTSVQWLWTTKYINILLKSSFVKL